MPIQVDVDQRHRDVVEAARRLIVGGGLAAVTFRNLAAELGCSTRVITNYLPTMRDVLLATYASVAGGTAADREALFARGEDAITILEGILPIGDDKVEDWVVWLCFWTAALFDAELACAHRKRNAATTARIARWLEEIGQPADMAAAHAVTIMTTIYGIAVQSVLDPAGWPPEAQRRHLRQVVEQMVAA